MKIPRKMTVALLAGVSIAGIAGASAASLGGVTSSQLGSGSNVVASCDKDGVAVAYNSTFINGSYKVTSATVSGVDALCAGETGSVTLANGTTGLGTASTLPGAVDGTGSFTVTFSTPVDASSVTGTAVLIAG